jgi:hypothetical protein
MPQSQNALAVSPRVFSGSFGCHFFRNLLIELPSVLFNQIVCRPSFQEDGPKYAVSYWSNEEGIHHFVRKIGVYCAYFSISEETNRREMLVEDLVSILGSTVQRQC